MELRARLVTFVVAVSLAAPAWIGSATVAQAASFDPSVAEQQLASAINQDRAQNGLGSLVVNPALSNIARGGSISVCGGQVVHGRSQDMVERSYFSHQIPSCGQTVFPALQSAGIQFSSAGENIGWNNYPTTTTVSQMNSDFMNSAGHRANILGNYTQVGVGAWMAPGPWSGSGAGTFDGVIVYTVIFTQGSGALVTSQPLGLQPYSIKSGLNGGLARPRPWNIARYWF